MSLKGDKFSSDRIVRTMKNMRGAARVAVLDVKLSPAKCRQNRIAIILFALRSGEYLVYV